MGNKMIEDVEARLIEIETVLANQERVIEDLNQVVIDQGKMIDRLAKQYQYLLDTAAGDAVRPLSEETPPPHY